MNQKIRRCLLSVHGWQWAVVGLLSLAVAGCGGAPTGDPDKVEVSGKVTFDGKPLPSAGAIIFHAPGGGSGGGGAGPIDSKGKYRVSLLPGTYQVSVSCSTMPAMPTGGGAPAERLEGPSTESLIPEKYNKPATSGLTAEIDGAQSGLDFDLMP